jgi:hypothetical protein
MPKVIIDTEIHILRRYQPSLTISRPKSTARFSSRDRKSSLYLVLAGAKLICL